MANATDPTELRKRHRKLLVDLLEIAKQHAAFAFTPADALGHHVTRSLKDLTNYIEEIIEEDHPDAGEREKRRRDSARGQRSKTRDKSS